MAKRPRKASLPLPSGVSCGLLRRGHREGERGREVAVGGDLRLEVSDLLLSEADGIGAAHEAARRRLLAGDRDQRPRELRRVSALLAALCLPPLQLLRRAPPRRLPDW